MQQNAYNYRKCMATPCIESTEGFWSDFWFKMYVAYIQSVNAFIGEFDIQKR